MQVVAVVVVAGVAECARSEWGRGESPSAR